MEKKIKIKRQEKKAQKLNFKKDSMKKYNIYEFNMILTIRLLSGEMEGLTPRVDMYFGSPSKDQIRKVYNKRRS